MATPAASARARDERPPHHLNARPAAGALCQPDHLPAAGRLGLFALDGLDGRHHGVGDPVGRDRRARSSRLPATPPRGGRGWPRPPDAPLCSARRALSILACSSPSSSSSANAMSCNMVSCGRLMTRSPRSRRPHGRLRGPWARQDARHLLAVAVGERALELLTGVKQAAHDRALGDSHGLRHFLVAEAVDLAHHDDAR